MVLPLAPDDDACTGVSYESGLITYMRTDSVNLSELALSSSRDAILSLMGERYVHTRQYATKTKGAQEAHEAIRPTYMSNESIERKFTGSTPV